ncbi:MAG: hypothetical protein J7L30_05050 [Methanophagales archaeon]|nr:hypothetical protein [Methanophagales archaeon]
MDLEGFAKRMLKRGAKEEEIISEMRKRILEIKDVSEDYAERLASAVLEEAKCTLRVFSEVKDDEMLRSVLQMSHSGVRMGEFGVGSRGSGDFYTHEKIAEIIGRTHAIADSSTLSDSGVVSLPQDKQNGHEAQKWQNGQKKTQTKQKYIVVTVDGMHSRLSDFPFLAGFHVARAALRDVYVMGAKPLALFSDIHVADDGDVAKIFEHIAGISAVADVVGVPLVTGSTLRIGGDSVIGTRMTGCVGAVGVASKIFTKDAAQPGDVILMTEGAGGGTISTAALYNGFYEVVRETLNIKFIRACEAIINEGISNIHTMTDVTNGGIRGDANEIAKVAGVKLVFYEEKIRELVNKKVLDMLNRLKIDYLGVSLDALLVICPEDVAACVREAVERAGVKISEVGFVEEAPQGGSAEIVVGGKLMSLVPRIREAA